MFTHQEELISKISDGQLQDFIYKQKDVLLLPIEVECGNLVFTELFKRWDKFVKLISETEWLQDSLPIVRKSMQYIKRAIKCYYALDIVASNNAMRNLLKVIQNTSLFQNSTNFIVTLSHHYGIEPVLEISIHILKMT